MWLPVIIRDEVMPCQLPFFRSGYRVTFKYPLQSPPLLIKAFIDIIRFGPTLILTAPGIAGHDTDSRVTSIANNMYELF